MPVLRNHGYRCDAVNRVMTSRAPYVYAVYDGQAVKIGKSRCHPLQRMWYLQTGSSRPLQLLGWTKAIAERRLQKLLWSRFHLRGEWFTADAALLRMLNKDLDWVDQPLMDAAIASANLNSGVTR